MPESETQVSMKQTWSDVGESFTSLGRVMRERYRSAPPRAAEPAVQARRRPRAATQAPVTPCAERSSR
jgi:hypothetical protein